MSLPQCDFPASLEGFDYRPGFLPRMTADRLLERLWEDLHWRQREIVLFGRRVAEPRLTVWMGDPGTRYRYSGLVLDPEPWHPALNRLRRRLEQDLKRPLNSVLATAYRNGRDGMGWHADDEAELGPEPVIASVSLGASRRFLVRRIGGGDSFAIRLDHGSVLIMSGHSQTSYQHALPKTARTSGLRVNLTFRNVLPQA